MIQLETRLRVADNCGARLVRCVGLGRSGSASRCIGGRLVVSVCRCRPRSRVERGRLYGAILVRSRKPVSRPGGHRLGFRSARVVLLRRGEKEPLPLGSRISVFLPLELRGRGLSRLLLLAPGLL